MMLLDFAIRHTWNYKKLYILSLYYIMYSMIHDCIVTLFLPVYIILSP